ncbi:GNAT family N-acetyltransferase [Streptomyces cucumeris]|uniref:GNAT family N-acetyltransferase n=1 Tax=Streptomyces cucumeris TaxID=2962890 RepID=UPI003EBDFC9E
MTTLHIPPTVRVELVPRERLEPHLDGIRSVYASAFGAPPWREDETMAGAYLDRLAEDTSRPGFLAALAREGGTVVGFATAWTTPTPFPAGRCYPQIAAALGPDRTRDLLCGGQEVDELAVHTRARGLGLGPALLHAITAPVADGRSWLLTSVRAVGTMRFYRRLGWRQITHPAPEGRGAAAFLGPRHPAPLPL